jgi:quercetin dioxygenase-like cupin family protein
MTRLMDIPIIHQISAIEGVIKELPQVELPLLHFRIPGVYVRVMEIPKGTVLTGKIHNYDCISIIAKGVISVNSIEGPKTLTAGDVSITPAGVKRVGFALEDTVFITVHHCDKANLAEIEDYLISETYEDFEKRLLS